MIPYCLGGAVEFLFTAQLQVHKNDVICYGKFPSALHTSYETMGANQQQRRYPIAICNHMIQHEISDPLPQHHGCHLIQLKWDHYGIDFTIIDRQAGRDSEKLFLVQVSATKYQKRTGPKLEEIYSKSVTLGSRSNLKLYSKKTGIDPENCYFVV